jgi:hypothetical protein
MAAAPSLENASVPVSSLLNSFQDLDMGKHLSPFRQELYVSYKLLEEPSQHEF